MTAAKTPSKSRGKPELMDYGDAFESMDQEASRHADSRFDVAASVVAKQTSAFAGVPAAEAPAGQGASSPRLTLVSSTSAAFEINALEVGKTYSVPLSLIDPNPYSPRYFYKPGAVDKTALSMEQDGQKVAVNGYVTPEGRVSLIEGGTRLRSARVIGAESLEVKIEQPPKDALELYNRAVDFHDQRTNHTGLDTAMLMRKLVDEKIVTTQDELAEKVKVNGQKPSRQLVNGYLRITKIPERLLLMMSEHEATSSYSTAYEISALFISEAYEKDPEKVEILAEGLVRDIIAKGLSYKNVRDIVASKLEGPKQRQRGNTTDVKMGDARGKLKVFDSRGQLDFSIRGLPADKLTQLKATIESICAGRVDLDQLSRAG
ncbi:ParB/RepB/Spo0J family partition protein [Ramlibacter sp. AN1133]|uniref:ParB/RepB/Spo0J family partition protein n=1 Tax=Ramlibacter sp. AN1133 TaxID=3133429 RepID=UPI0030BFF641